MVTRQFLYVIVQYWNGQLKRFDQYRTGPMFKLHEYESTSACVQAAVQWAKNNIPIGQPPPDFPAYFDFTVSGTSLSRMEYGADS